MRIQGNTSPAPVLVEAYPPKVGMMRLWLRENIQQLEDGLYEYDEYTTILPEKAGLEAEVNANRSDWLQTLRNLEVDDRASVVVDMKEGLEDYNALIMALSEVYEDAE